MNWKHKPSKVAIVGCSGSGKTTYLCRYTAAVRAVKFIFDGEGELGRRLGVKTARTPGELIDGAVRGLVCYDPALMYEGETENAFRFFCKWTFEISRKIRGRKLFVCDELSKWMENTRRFPREFKNLMETGRREEIDAVFICQRPQDITGQARQQVTEYVALKQGDHLPADFLRTMGFDAGELLAMPPGKFICRTNQGKETRGKLF
jgi:hypothetical protein